MKLDALCVCMWGDGGVRVLECAQAKCSSTPFFSHFFFLHFFIFLFSSITEWK